MSFSGVIATVHALGGATLVILGAIVLSRPKRRGAHTRLGRAYYWLLVATLALGLALGVRDPGISVFEAQTVPALIAGTVAYVAARRRRGWLGASWLFWHIGGQIASYAAVIAATLNQTVGRALPPTPAVALALSAIPAAIAFVAGVKAMAARGLLSPADIRRSDPAPSGP
jgi:hypothetical protein